MPLATLMLHLEPVEGGKLRSIQQAASEHLKQLVARIGYKDLSASDNSGLVRQEAVHGQGRAWSSWLHGPGCSSQSVWG